MDVFCHSLINMFLKPIMSDALVEHGRRVSIGGRNITNLEFADDLDAQAEEEQKPWLKVLTKPAQGIR